MPAPPGDDVDPAGRAQRVGDQGVDERGLADPGVSDEHGHPAGQGVADAVETVDRVRAGVAGGHGRDDHGHAEGLVGLAQRSGVGEVRLGQAQQDVHAGVVGGDDAAVDHAGPRLGVREGGHDDQLVGVRHDDPLDRVRVVRGAAQHGRALGDAHDARERACRARRVADDVDEVTAHHAVAQLPGAHADDGALLWRVRRDEDGVPAAVDAGDESALGVGVLGAQLGAGA